MELQEDLVKLGITAKACRVDRFEDGSLAGPAVVLHEGPQAYRIPVVTQGHTYLLLEQAAEVGFTDRAPPGDFLQVQRKALPLHERKRARD